MPSIAKLSVEDWKRLVCGSNAEAMKKRHKYPPREAEYLARCCVFVPQDCGPRCFCRSVGCKGVWTVSPDLDFEAFIDCYADLWVQGHRCCLRGYLENPPPDLGPRRKNLPPLLRKLKERWDDWTGDGRSLPLLASLIRRCFFCDDAFRLAGPFVQTIQSWSRENSGVYASKVISQLFYDIAVPFDTLAKQKQKAQGYDPEKYGEGQMQLEARKWLRDHRVSVDEFRRLDDAPERHWSALSQPRPRLTACSRLFDKLFYA